MRIGANRLLNTTAFIALSAALPTAAFAQTEAADASTGEAETIVVTGSRIARPQLEGSSPVTVINAAEVKLSGTTRAEDLLNNMPQVFAGQSSGVANGSTGTATVNLRSLGAVRTLVLVNGRRLPPGTPILPVADLNAIPANLIERVDVLTGGASSIYGADAVAGVVNFVMDTDFEGFKVDANYGFYQHNNDGDPRARAAIEARRANNPAAYPLPTGNTVGGGQFDTTLTFGVGTDDGRGHLTAYAGYRKVKELLQVDYDYSACALAGVAGQDAFTCGGSPTASPAQIYVFAPGFAQQIDVDPSVAGTNGYVPTGSGFTGFRTFLAADQYNFAPTNHFQRPDERFTFGAFAEYEVSDMFTPYLEFSFMNDRNISQIAASGVFTEPVVLACDNPLLSAAQRTALCPAVGQQEAFIAVARRNTEGGGRQSDFNFDQYRIVAGFKGNLSENWSYDMYGQYGRSNYALTFLNEFSISRTQLALDAVVDPDTGAIVCRDATARAAGCAPYNPFRGAGIVADPLNGVTQAALDYLSTPGFQRGNTTEQIVSASVSGDLGITSPWASSGFGLALGAEYRKEGLDLATDVAFTTGDLAGQGGPTIGVSGGFDVKEVFGEVRLPIVEDMPFFNELALEASYRYSDYQTNGPTGSNSFNTDTYRLGAEWSPVEGVRVRGSYNRAVRAPNVIELFSSQALGLFSGEDPCSGTTPVFTREQCARTGVTAAQYGSISANSADQYNQYTGGNPNLDPEVADTWTAGVVFAPRGMLSGFTLAVDYFNIKIEDTIGTVGAQIILNQCGLTGEAVFCDNIRRTSAGSLFLGAEGNAQTGSGFVRNTNVNIGSVETSGVDIAASYAMDLGEGGLAFNFVGSWLDTLITNPGTPITSGGQTYTSYDCAGYYGQNCVVPNPEWRHRFRVTYNAPSVWSVSANWRYVGALQNEDVSTNPYIGTSTRYPTSDEVPSQSYFDLAFTADVTEYATFRLGVNNILDNDPPLLAGQTIPTSPANGNTYPGTWDTLGRYIFVGATFSF